MRASGRGRRCRNGRTRRLDFQGGGNSDRSLAWRDWHGRLNEPETKAIGGAPHTQRRGCSMERCFFVTRTVLTSSGPPPAATIQIGTCRLRFDVKSSKVTQDVTILPLGEITVCQRSRGSCVIAEIVAGK